MDYYHLVLFNTGCEYNYYSQYSHIPNMVECLHITVNCTKPRRQLESVQPTPPTATATTSDSSQVPSTAGTGAEEVAVEPPRPRAKRRRSSAKNSEAPVWFTEWAAESNTLMSQLVEETKRKNDLLEKLIDKL